jgi:beta-lactamase superfamily II metal-dependent hydrolase
LPNDSEIKVVYVEQDVSVNDGLPLRDMTMILRFEVLDSSVLFSGDLGRYMGEQLTGRTDMKADFLKMPYPGPGDTVPTSFYKTVDPKYVLVPAPKRQWCSDDGRLAREWVIKNELPTWVTGGNGNIHVIWHTDKTVISPQHIDERCKLREFSNMVIKK